MLYLQFQKGKHDNMKYHLGTQMALIVWWYMLYKYVIIFNYYWKSGQNRLCYSTLPYEIHKPI